MKECFIEKNFRTESLRLIQIAEQIMTQYARQGYDLSLRQLYYQFVARNVIPNSEKSYKNLGNLISDARLAGLLDWDIIKDRGREVVENPHWDTPNDILNAAARSFRIDKWEDQPNHVMVMVEKQALEGVLVPVCRELDIRFIANKGYSSSTTLKELGDDLATLSDQGKTNYILYFGDHDPSGIDMTRDVLDRICLFARGHVHVQRIALNMDQVEQYGPPENPAKTTDSRYEAYIRKYGESSWELDALEPTVLAALVREEVILLRDEDLWDAAVEKEAKMRSDLNHMAKTYKFDGA
jgi:hypothetical protein